MSGESVQKKISNSIFYLLFENFVQYIFIMFFPDPQLLPDSPLSPPNLVFFLFLKKNLRLFVFMAVHNGLEINHQNELVFF